MRFLVSETSYFPTSDFSHKISEILPPNNFVIKVDRERGMFFEMIDSFKFDGKIYGNPINRAKKILNTYEKRSNSTGVLLSGRKGSGKTLLAKMLSTLGAEIGYPTIVINAAYYGDAFNMLIQSITQPCIILFDEFEKVYNSDVQQAILTLLDGVFPTKKLFIFTCNDYTRIDQHLQNRPGRIFYTIQYKGLEAAFVKEYCEDNLKNKKHIKEVIKLFHLFDDFNFDILKALVEEMNRYDETVQEAMIMLNAKTYSLDYSQYTIEVYDGETKLHANSYSPNRTDKNPTMYENLSIVINNPKSTNPNTNPKSTHVQNLPISHDINDSVSATATDMVNTLREMLAGDSDESESKSKKKIRPITLSISQTTKRSIEVDGTIVYKINRYIIKCVKVQYQRDYTAYMDD